MSLTVGDFSDLARLLEEHPEWRSELRRLLLSDELLSLPQALRELVEVQKRSKDRLSGVEERLSRLETTVQNLAEQMGVLVEQVRALVESQHRMGDTMGSMKGRLLELTYREKAGAYFGPLLRRLRVVEPHTLEDALEANLTPESKGGLKGRMLEEIADRAEAGLEPLYDHEEVWKEIEKLEAKGEFRV